MSEQHLPLDEESVALMEEPGGRLIIFLRSIPVGHVVYSRAQRTLGLAPSGRFGDDARTLLRAAGGSRLAQALVGCWARLDMRMEPATPGTDVVAIYQDGTVWGPPCDADGTVLEPGWAALSYLGPRQGGAWTG